MAAIDTPLPPWVSMTPAPDDPFAHIRDATHAHRAQHGCGAHPYRNGPLLGALAAAVGARRILELGTALGYTALWLAHRAPGALVDTVQRRGQHPPRARQPGAAVRPDR